MILRNWGLLSPKYTKFGKLTVKGRIVQNSTVTALVVE
jgi:hypothetical protein